MNPLRNLHDCGQSPWLDNLSRSLVNSGELARLIDRDGLCGITSNPSIFEKAIGAGEDYDEAFRAFLADGDHGVTAIYEHLAIADVRAAADLLCGVYGESEGRDGYVSLECSPYLANDTEATMIEARRLWGTVGRRNLMVKVPATRAGLPAIRRLIADGININVTLLFSIEAYEDVVEAYLAGLEERLAKGENLRHIGSVASIFVSRIDTAVDVLLDQLDTKPIADRLRGKIGIANAKLIYARSKVLFSGHRWQRLAAAGAQTQRLLWASTGTKNPTARDTLYVEALIGRDTVDTIPPATMDAFRDHGLVVANSLEADLSGARIQLAELELNKISLKSVCDGLLAEGVDKFATSFDELLGTIARRRRLLIDGDDPRQETLAGSPELAKAVASELQGWRRHGRIRGLWAGDATLWTGHDEADWLGWLTSVESALDETDRITHFAEKLRRAGTTDVVLLGMGGSSLGPEVLSTTFGTYAGRPRFHLLDSTDPAEIAAIDAAIDLPTTLFIVSSKSGSTLEPTIFLDYFHARVAALDAARPAGSHFIAITDRGSALDQRAQELHFAQIFHGFPSIGGRYSVLSPFGLVPAAAIGIDIERLLKTTAPMLRSCGADVPPSENPGVQLGVFLGVAATQFGRDKVTIIASPALASIGSWLEQLLAESTGKDARGIIPLAGEPLGRPTSYGDDRLFVFIEQDGDHTPDQRDLLKALQFDGHPIVHIKVKDIWHLGQEFIRWEVAVAVAGAIIGINPFNQPDVEASKQKTAALMQAYDHTHDLQVEVPIFRENGSALYADPGNAAELGRHNTLAGYLRTHFERTIAGGPAGDYIAILAYVARTEATEIALGALAGQLRDARRAATCHGFGPRFQHSTGQAFKGGANTGTFLQITCDDPADIIVPGHAYSFGIVKRAQARGDFDALVERDRRLLRIHLHNVDTGLVDLANALTSAFGAN